MNENFYNIFTKIICITIVAVLFVFYIQSFLYEKKAKSIFTEKLRSDYNYIQETVNNILSEEKSTKLSDTELLKSIKDVCNSSLSTERS